jgi:transposase
VRRIDELFEIERTINGKAPAERAAVRRDQSKPLVEALDTWLREQRALLSAKSDLVKAINYGLSRWAAFTRFLDDGRACLSIDNWLTHRFFTARRRAPGAGR